MVSKRHDGMTMWATAKADGADAYDLEGRERSLALFGEMMYGIRKELYDLHTADEALSKKMQEVFAGDDIRFTYYKTAKKLGFERHAESGMSRMLRSRPRALQHMMNQQHNILDKKMENTQQYLGLIAQERNSLLRHVKYLHLEGRRLISIGKMTQETEKNSTSRYESIMKTLHEVEERYKADEPGLEDILQTHKEEEIAAKLQLEESQRTSQNLHIRKNMLYNASATSRLLLEQMDLAYAQVDLMRETLGAQKDYTRVIVNGQMALGIVLEDTEKILIQYNGYRNVCNKLLTGINVGIQALLKELVATARKPLYEVQSLTDGAALCKESSTILKEYRQYAQELSSHAGKEYASMRKLLEGLDAAVTRLEPYAPAEDVRRYEDLVIRR